MADMTCPTCGKSFAKAASRSLPFCSPRCKQIDLGRWLNEELRVPYDPPPEDEARERPPAANDSE